jgi:hypothetical protein
VCQPEFNKSHVTLKQIDMQQQMRDENNNFQSRKNMDDEIDWMWMMRRYNKRGRTTYNNAPLNKRPLVRKVDNNNIEFGILEN